MEVDKWITQRSNETLSAFHQRKIAFLKIYNKTNDVNRAIKFSNIWSNIQQLKCTYDPVLMQELNSYLWCRIILIVNIRSEMNDSELHER